MNKRVDCPKIDRFHPIGYERVSISVYLDAMDELKEEYISNPKYDEYGLSRDEEENEYLFLFHHPDLKYYVFNIFDEINENGIVQTHEINFFGEIEIRDFSYYSNLIMTNQLIHSDEVLKNLQDVYLGKFVDTNCENNSKEIFKILWLPRIIEQMQQIMENNLSSKEISNYKELYEEVKSIEADLGNDFPEFNLKYQLSEKQFKADNLLTFLRRDHSIGKYCEEKQKFTMNYLSKEICYIIGRFFYEMEKSGQKIKQKEFCSLFSKYILCRDKNELKVGNLVKLSSTYKNDIIKNEGKPFNEIFENIEIKKRNYH